jgi:hypothetical protein
MEWSEATPNTSSIVYSFMHLTQTPPCRRTPRVLERLLLLRRAARRRHVAEEDVDVDVVLVVVVVGVPCLSHRRKFVVWTRRKTMTSIPVWRKRYCPPAHMEETCLFMEETCMV